MSGGGAGSAVSGKVVSRVFFIHAVSMVAWMFLWESLVGFWRLSDDLLRWGLPFLVVFLPSAFCMCQEGSEIKKLSAADEREKLKLIDGSAQMLVSTIAIFIAVLAFFGTTAELSGTTRFPSLPVVAMLVGLFIFVGLLPLYWMRAGDGEEIRLIALRHLKSACFAQCLSWTATLFIMVLYVMSL